MTGPKNDERGGAQKCQPGYWHGDGRGERRAGDCGSMGYEVVWVTASFETDGYWFRNRKSFPTLGNGNHCLAGSEPWLEAAVLGPARELCRRAGYHGHPRETTQ
jgi:hypothetical protein